MPQPAKRTSGWWERLARHQAAHPWRHVLLAVLLAAGSLPLVLQLSLRSFFTDMLPVHAPSVQAFDEMMDRLGISATLSVAIHGDDLAAVRALTSELGRSLEAEPPADVTCVDWNLSAFQDFVETNRYLYADFDDIEEVYDAVAEYIDWEQAKANPMFVALDGGEPEHPRETVARIKARAGAAERTLDRFPGGLLQHPELPLTVLFVRTTIQSGELERARALVAAMQARVAALAPDLAARGLQVDYGGDLMDMLEEIAALRREILLATVATIVLVLLAVVAFFRRLRAIPLLAASLVAPVLLTFAFAELTVDFLNTSTAFLGSIVIGNGINPNIIWLARYFEGRRAGRPIEAAIAAAHRGVWTATLTASAAAGLAYASLALTDFRGFRDFGIIGGAGMLLCWLGAFALLPAFAGLWDRWRPLETRSAGAAHRNVYGSLFAWLALKTPRAVVVGAVLLTVVSSVVVGVAIVRDPIEYDYRRLSSKRDPDSRVTWVNDRQGEIVNETATGSGITILVPDRAAARHVRDQLEASRDRVPEILGNVLTYDILLPDQQEEKIEILEELRARLVKLLPRLDAADRAEVEAHLPPADLEEITDADIPEPVARLFTERDGSVGNLVFVEHHDSKNEWDGMYLLEWSEAARAVTLADGTPPAVSGRPPIFADLLASMLTDGPKAVAIALSATILLLLVAFRKLLPRVLTLAALLGGILWMAAAMALFRIRLNFLNFVAFPITFGNGVDYGVNVTQRVMQELGRQDDPQAAIRDGIEATGGAVILCSLTTVIGYISLYASSNQALNSFGAAMAISEVTCLASAVICIPAVVSLRAGKGRNPAGAGL